MAPMKVSLERVDARGLRVDFPGASGESIAIASASGLVGTLEHHGERLVLSGVAAERVELAAVRLLLDGLVLSTQSAVDLTGITLALDQSGASLSVDVGALGVAAVDLNVAVEDVVVRGKATLTRAQLALRGDEGTLSAEQVDLAEFFLRIGDLELKAEALSGASVQIGWGAAGFRLSATSIAGPALLVTSKEDARIDAREVALTALVVANGGITIGTLVAASAQSSFTLAVDPPAPAESASSPSPASPSAVAAEAAPLFDWRVLDGVSGELDVDLLVDVTVPIIGHRKATHRFRIPIADGALDYRALERNLAKLEDALLDFSVREGMLVLERVNPLYPVRGHGKPVVVWDVDALDHELAERDRVRLAVLPQARLFEAESAGDEPSSIALRELALLRINAQLALAALDRPLAGPLEGQLRPRHIGSLVLAGNVYHEAHHTEAAPREGSLLGELADLSLSIVGLPVGTGRLDATTIAAAAISPIEVAFAGASPKAIALGITGLRLEAVTLHDR